MERRTVIYRGDVQGVGFRWRTVRAVEGTGVTGYVRNLRDGTVELVLEGEAAVVREAQERVEEAVAHHVREKAVTVTAATGAFSGFGVRR